MESQQTVISPLTSELTILIVDDHEMVLSGTLHTLQNAYRAATIVTTDHAAAALEIAAQKSLDLAIVDLSMPHTIGQSANLEIGLQLVKTLMQTYPTLNIVVQSANTSALIRLLPAIKNHGGGFTIVDKSASAQELLMKVDWALRETIYTPKEMRNQGIELKPEWQKILHLGIVEALQDKEIAKQMNIAPRTVRNYWSQIQDALEIYPDPEDKRNIRMQTANRARELHLIE